LRSSGPNGIRNQISLEYIAPAKVNAASQSGTLSVTLLFRVTEDAETSISAVSKVLAAKRSLSACKQTLTGKNDDKVGLNGIQTEQNENKDEGTLNFFVIHLCCCTSLFI